MWHDGKWMTIALAGLLMIAATARAGDVPTAAEQRAEGSVRGPAQFTGARSVTGEIADDRARRDGYLGLPELHDALEPWYVWKGRVREETGLDFAFSYSALYQRASHTGPGDERDAAGGVARFLGTWTLVGRGTENTGAFVYRVEHRHTLGTDVPPTELGESAGSGTPTARTFSDFQWGATIAYWKQRLFDGRVVVLAGRVDPTDYYDMYALNSSQSHFLNQAFGSSPTLSAPSFGFGAAAGVMVTEHLYAIGGLSDATGSATRSRWSDLRDEKEFFTHAEFGWTPQQDRLARDNIHLGFWNKERRSGADIPSDWGLTFSGSTELANGLTPFLRAGYANGETARQDRVVTAGIAVQHATDNLFGVGVSWGRPTDRDLDDQVTTELFYRIQLAENVHLTPDLQLVLDPSNDPGSSALWIAGLRLRISF